mmetsp:Transcript_10372/g.20260  ORF Transcript_10372/g.20260 Transcript_10372/m.20260 type:complete len:291 (+) Transcript_10372:151-1023(+)
MLWLRMDTTHTNMSCRTHCLCTRASEGETRQHGNFYIFFDGLAVGLETGDVGGDVGEELVSNRLAGLRFLRKHPESSHHRQATVVHLLIVTREQLLRVFGSDSEGVPSVVSWFLVFPQPVSTMCDVELRGPEGFVDDHVTQCEPLESRDQPVDFVPLLERSARGGWEDGMELLRQQDPGDRQHAHAPVQQLGVAVLGENGRRLSLGEPHRIKSVFLAEDHIVVHLAVHVGEGVVAPITEHGGLGRDGSRRLCVVAGLLRHNLRQGARHRESTLESGLGRNGGSIGHVEKA